MHGNENSLNMLRMLWKEGCSLRDRWVSDESSYEWKEQVDEATGWLERVKLVFRHVFYNIKFHDDFVTALNVAYDRDYCDVSKALSIANQHIKSLGQLLKYGYVKDPISGVDNTGSKICFVAMWFDKVMDNIYTYGIRQPMEALGYEVVRVDKQQHNDRIDAKIFELIRKSRFLIADFTGNRSGVYYEAGFASGQGIPVVHTCRLDGFDSLHFDVKTINTIGYSNYPELSAALSERVTATIGRFVDKTALPVEDDSLPF